MENYLSDWKNCIAFGMWLFNRQTLDEINKGETIEDNGIGFNSPDAKFLSNMFICIKDGVKFSDKDLINWSYSYLRPRLLKYKKQFKIYETKTTSN